MAKLIYVESSPRKLRSKSIAVAREFLDVYSRENPDDKIERMDLWDCTLPEFTGDVIEAKYAILHGMEHTTEQAAAWQMVAEICRWFRRADAYLFSMPMWNFGVPYKFKHLVDVLTQPGLTFDFSPETGYYGLVTGKPAAVIYARGGEYPAETEMAAFDLQRPYIEMWLRFIGFTEIESIVIEPTLDPVRGEEVIRTAIDSARRLAARFHAAGSLYEESIA